MVLPRQADTFESLDAVGSGGIDNGTRHDAVFYDSGIH